MRKDGVPGKDVVKSADSPNSNAYKAHQLRVSGMSWTDIAPLTGYSSAKSAEVEVRRYLGRAAEMLSAEERAHALDLEMTRLDALLNAIWDQAMDGDVKAVDSCLRVISTRSRLLGLENPIATGTVTHNTVVVTGATTEDYVQKLQQFVGATHE